MASIGAPVLADGVFTQVVHCSSKNATSFFIIP
jgi:hypothetical protein